MTPSAISVSDGLDVDTLDISGALTSDAITPADMMAGRWDGAAARLFAVDWTDPAGSTLHLTRGELGDVSISDGAFSAELRGPTSLLERPVVERTSPECRASLGDRRCRVDMGPRTRFARVVSVDGLTITIDAAEPGENVYGYGRVDWVTGANSGIAGLRVAGTVIWATDLREDRHHSGGGKSGGSTTSYSYSTSFAVALSARPIEGVGRIWADGNLLRGQAGDWKSTLGGFRLYLGDEDQPIDPLIASAEGIDAAPAYRGLAYAVFDTLQLADFGNRIPSLTFEVLADGDPVAVTAIAAELSEGALIGEAGATLIGYAASGDSVRSALQVLAQAFPMSVSDDGAQLRIGSTISTIMDQKELGAGAGEDRQPRWARERQSAAALPDALSIQYYEPARDYQAGIQQSRRDGIGLARRPSSWRRRSKRIRPRPWRRPHWRAPGRHGIGRRRGCRGGGWRLGRERLLPSRGTMSRAFRDGRWRRWRWS